MDAIAKHADLATAVDRPPYLVAAVGRGRVGKKLFGRWMAETLRHEGRTVQVWDCNREPPGLRKYFSDAKTPTSRDMEDRRRLIEDGLGDMAAKAYAGTPYDVVLDVGGDDVLLKRLGYELSLAETLEEAGIALVAVHVIGDKEDDLRYLESVEKSGLFKPRRACILQNYGMISAYAKPAEAFGPVLEHPAVVAFKARGGHVVKMEALTPECITELEKGRTFHEIASKLKPLDPKAFRIKVWLAGMDAVRAELADVLP